jgi:predicted DNA repair protein MutK
VPAALAISALAPWLITPLLIVGGLFLCFEGVEKVAHKLLVSRAEEDAHHAELTQALADPNADMAAIERDKIKGAVRTDFILSAEIIVIALGTVAGRPLGTQVAVLVGIALLMTVGVYGLVAGIVKLDDLGLHLSRLGGALAALGRGILRAAPWLMKGLSIAGTAAMFLVGGGILVHGVPALHHLVEAVSQRLGAALQPVVEMLGNALAGIVAGALVLALVSAGQWFWRRLRAPAVAA